LKFLEEVSDWWASQEKLSSMELVGSRVFILNVNIYWLMGKQATTDKILNPLE
jgi:hypothetical protein